MGYAITEEVIFNIPSCLAFLFANRHLKQVKWQRLVEELVREWLRRFLLLVMIKLPVHVASIRQCRKSFLSSVYHQIFHNSFCELCFYIQTISLTSPRVAIYNLQSKSKQFTSVDTSCWFSLEVLPSHSTGKLIFFKVWLVRCFLCEILNFSFMNLKN